MPRKVDEPKVRVHVHLFASDVPRIHQLFGRTIGFSGAIRSIVRLGLRKFENEAEKNSKILDIDLGE